MSEASSMPPLPEHVIAPLVQIDAAKYGVALDVRYATANNLTGRAFYRHARVYLRPEAADALKNAAALAHALGLKLLLFDGYRPVAGQMALWQACPDEAYVYPPWKGSTHTRGIAVDLSLIEAESGRPLDMGTDFDDMSPRSHPSCRAVSQAALANRMLLAGIMTTAGFEGIPTEWWHFQLPDPESWPLIDERSLPEPLVISDG